MLAEEFGLVGGLVGAGALRGVILYGMLIALRCRHQFGRLVALGVTMNFFLYVFINIAMVMGAIPVVGVPLPLVSLRRQRDADGDDRHGGADERARPPRRGTEPPGRHRHRLIPVALSTSRIAFAIRRPPAGA
jgi:hypothetical protein